jgi:hypothetical protein
MGDFSFANYFADINLLADLQFMPGEKPIIDRPPAAYEPKDLLLYLGCNILRTAHLAKSAIGVLKAMGFDFNAAGGPAHCCGIVHFQHEEPGKARSYAASSMRHLARYVLMWCPSCNEHYDEVVSKEQTVTFPYEHVSSFIARHLDRIQFVRTVEKRVAVHYHTGFPQADSDWRTCFRSWRPYRASSWSRFPTRPKWAGTARRNGSVAWVSRGGGSPSLRRCSVQEKRG